MAITNLASLFDCWFWCSKSSTLTKNFCEYLQVLKMLIYLVHTSKQSVATTSIQYFDAIASVYYNLECFYTHASKHHDMRKKLPNIET